MFILFSTDDDRQQPTEYLPCSAIQPKYGMAMKMTGGKLAKATAADVPEYICLREESAAVAAGDLIPVAKIQADQVWQTTGTSAMVVGTGYDINTDALGVKTTSAGGAAFIVNHVEDDGTVRGRFKTAAAS